MYPQLLLSPVLLVSVEATYRSISEKDRKGRAILSNAFFYWKLDLRLDFSAGIFVWGNDTSNIPPPSMNTIDNTFPEVQVFFVLYCICACSTQLRRRRCITARGPTNRGIGSSSTGISRQAETGGWGSANLWCCRRLRPMSALIYREKAPVARTISIAAVHWYLVNAILMLSAKHLSCRSRFTSLSLIGDVLF
jgi:hypothetical protein